MEQIFTKDSVIELGSARRIEVGRRYPVSEFLLYGQSIILKA